MILAGALLIQAAPSASRPTAHPPPANAARQDERISGIWFDIFEDPLFLADQTVPPTDIAPGTLPALRLERWQAFAALSSPSLAHQRLVDPTSPHAYTITFMGHRDQLVDCRAGLAAGRPQPPTWGCVGIGGVHPYAITVTRILAIADAGSMPRFSSDNRR